MKRFHVHVSVDDLEANVKFYSTVFGALPTVVKSDYAKWMVDDPRINFASRRGTPGRSSRYPVDSGELTRCEGVAVRRSPRDQPCGLLLCPLRKYWTTDPQRSRGAFHP
jgi:catechol 2,3-dioxygenase-like lactoylglutathione lyase family enzyme